MSNNNTAYSEQFKPALFFGISPLSFLADRVYLSKSQEDYSLHGSHMAQVTPDVEATDKQTDSLFFYKFETANAEIEPTVRPVEVKGKTDFTDCFLIEPKLGAKGVAVVMFKEKKNKAITDIYCNVRVMPYATVSELVLSSKPGSLVIDLPKKEIVKVNITLAPSSTGEILYSTNKTEISLSDINKEDKVTLARDLEYHFAKVAAHMSGSMLEVVAEKDAQLASEHTSHYIIRFPEGENKVLKEHLVGVGIIGTSMIDLTGVIAVGDINTDWQFAGDFLNEVLT